MKKVRDIPPEWKEAADKIQTPEYQEHLRLCVAEVGQEKLAKSFTCGKQDNGLELGELDFQILASCRKPIPTDLDDKHSLWEEGDEVCYSYGILTLRGLIRWTLESGKKGTWLLARLTQAGEEIAVPIHSSSASKVE
jgi:hypothetical protein